MANRLAAMAFAAALLSAGGAWGEPAPDTTRTPEPTSVADPATLGPEALEAASAGQAVKVEALANQQLTGTTTGNIITANTLTSGPVSFSADALRGFSGVGNFVINTGANNTLQGAINISIVTAAPGP
jgi:hypothetical protein